MREIVFLRPPATDPDLFGRVSYTLSHDTGPLAVPAGMRGLGAIRRVVICRVSRQDHCEVKCHATSADYGGIDHLV